MGSAGYLRRARRLAVIAVILLALPSLSGAKRQRPQIIAGKVSAFGPPAEGAGRTASGASSAQPGIALWGRSHTLDRHYCVTLHRGRLHAVLKHIDAGPAPWTGRMIDVTGAGVRKFRGRGRFVTDALAHARLLPRRRGLSGGAASGENQASRSNHTPNPGGRPRFLLPGRGRRASFRSLMGKSTIPHHHQVAELAA